MPAQPSRVLQWVVAIPLAAATLATGLFFLQGGFGGGHGRFDGAIALLGLPSVFLVEVVPLAHLLEKSDLLLVVWVPAAANSILWALAGLGVEALRRAQRGPSPN